MKIVAHFTGKHPIKMDKNDPILQELVNLLQL